MDAELHLAPTPGAASAWLDAPMLGAAICLLQADALVDMQDAQRVGVSRDLQRQLAAAAGTTLAEDAAGNLWRIRALGAGNVPSVWLLQALTRSRFTLAAQLRATLAQRLAGHVLHELRNPLNAVSLYADVLTMLVPKAAQAEAQDKAVTALRSIKDRLQELSLRQQTSVVIWSGETEVEPPVPVSGIWREVSRLIGAYLTLNAIPLRSAGLDVLEQCALTCPRPLLTLAWLGLLMMAADAAARHPEGSVERRLQLRAVAAGATAVELQVAGPLDSAALGAELGLADNPAAAATLSLLLQGSPARLAPATDGGMLLSLGSAPA